MGYTVSIEAKDRHLNVRVSGDNTPEIVRAYLKDIYQACAGTGIPVVLIVESLRGPALDPVDVYRIIVESSARTAPVLHRIDYVDLSPERSDANIVLDEAVARDHGANIPAFPAVAAAEQWLAVEVAVDEN